MTNAEHKMFSKMLDLNYEIKTGTHTKAKFTQMEQELEVVTQELTDSMGEENYNQFINMGRKMMASKN